MIPLFSPFASGSSYIQYKLCLIDTKTLLTHHNVGGNYSLVIHTYQTEIAQSFIVCVLTLIKPVSRNQLSDGRGEFNDAS